MSIRNKIDNLLTEAKVAKGVLDNCQQDIVNAEEELIACEEAQGIAQVVAQQVQQEAHNQIAGVVTKCLEAVFDEPYEFKIHFEKKRGRTEASLIFERDGLEIDPLTASGGGVVDVAAFALRLSCIMLSKPTLRRVLIMDEPFKFISDEFKERVRILLETLSKDMGVQFIMVTHIDELKTGNIIEV